ncbi:NAD(P)H-hydrate dehydratase [Candidatus Peregrinibacteria bacterium]|nr:NAD(P)H-hydrate dehydratase [Candidatus Peregrinibacteria bacterium]
MIQTITKNSIRDLLPRRKKTSHKGQNGCVLIIGGSRDFFGAPILSALGAIRTGADLVHLFVPECNFDVSRCYLPEFIVHSYSGDYFHEEAVFLALSLIDLCDSVVIGPGMTDREEVLVGISIFLKKISCPVVIDADALPVVKNMYLHDKQAVLTPHAGEFQELIDKKLPDDIASREKILCEYARSQGVTVLLKGHSDFIASREGKIVVNKTGNPGMTAGGTGDVLAGVVSSLIAQKVEPFFACQIAAFLVGTSGDFLAQKKSYGYLASEVANTIPEVIRDILAQEPKIA